MVATTHVGGYLTENLSNPNSLHQVELAGKSHSPKSTQLGKDCAVLEYEVSVGKMIAGREPNKSWRKDRTSEQGL